MKKRSKNYKAAAASLICTTFLFACSNGSETNTSNETKLKAASAANVMSAEEISKKVSELVSYNPDDEYSEWENENPTQITLSGHYASFDSTSAVIFKENILTIKAGGTYVLSGQLNDGQVVVDAEDKKTVRLVLNGVEINSSDSAAIYVTKAEKTTISLVEGTENLISDGKVYAASSEDEPNAAIFSKSHLTINGSGKLIVNGNYNNGITSKDELKITGGNIQVKAVDDGVMGRDLVAVKEGTLTVDAGGDGVKSSNDKDSSKGNIVLEGGTYDIEAAKDGIQAITSLWITDGSYKISSGGGSPETISSNNERMGGQRGNMNTATTTTETDTESTKGLKAAVDLVIGGGTFAVDALDDAVHSNGNVFVAGGELTIASGDDGLHAETSLGTSGGKINITKSYEGIESKTITFADGDIDVTSSDDGINVGGGNDGSGMDMQSASEDSMLFINGGNIVVNASGDGLDSNGSFAMTGGTVLVNGPTNDGNGPLDYNGSFELSGGLIIAAGSAGMAQAASEQSSQNSLLMTYPETQAAGTMVHLEDEKGNTIVSFKPSKDYQSVFIGSPELKKDSKYILFSGGKSTGSETAGLYKDGDYSGGTKVVEFTISDSVTWLDESGVTEARSEGPGGGGFGGGQNRPERGAQGGMFGDLDEETRGKVQTIMEQERAGTITREEAQQQLSELGVE